MYPPRLSFWLRTQNTSAETFYTWIGCFRRRDGYAAVVYGPPLSTSDMRQYVKVKLDQAHLVATRGDLSCIAQTRLRIEAGLGYLLCVLL